MDVMKEPERKKTGVSPYYVHMDLYMNSLLYYQMRPVSTVLPPEGWPGFMNAVRLPNTIQKAVYEK